MATQTWDTSRTGGGTYEFTQDAQGNYVLGSVGFAKLNKLNLPELKAEATTTTADTAKTAATVSAQTKQAFGDVQPFYYDQKGEGGTGTQYTMRKEGDLSTDIKPMVTGDTFTQARQAMTTDAAYRGTDIATKKEPDLPPWAQGVDRRGWSTEAMQKVPDQTLQVGRQNIDQVLAARAKAEKAKPQIIKPSDRQPGFAVANLRKTEVTPTKLRNVRTNLKTLANTVGIALNPAVGIGKMLLGTVQDTPTQAHARKYFNTRGDNTSRIAGNPTTDLYAGMNQTSAFGNLERSGERRIETRERTIAKKGYKAGDKFFDDTQNMKNQQKDYSRSKAAAKNKADLATGGVAPGASGGGNGGTGGGKSIICTQMYQQTHLEDWKKTMQLWYIFQKKYLTIEHQEGYHFLFKPFVNGMKKSKILTTIGKYCAIARTNDIKHIMFRTPFSLSGRLVRLVTEPICYIIGKIKSWL